MGFKKKLQGKVEAIAFGLGGAYLLLLVAVLWGIWMGGDRWWWGTALLFAPRWPWLAPALLLLPLVFLGRRCRLIIVGIAVVAVFLLGLRAPLTALAVGGDSDEPLKVVTMNVNRNEAALEGLLASHADAVDVIFLQEANSAATSKRFPEGWSIADAGSGITVISPHPMSEVESLSRVYMPEWGDSAVRCVVSTERGDIRLVGVHLRTPRDGVEALIGKKLAGVTQMRQTIFERSEEARAVRHWVNSWKAAPGAPMIVAGDFNTPVESWLYQRYWADLTNAFGAAGLGLGYTKRTRWHGVRIDHVLGNDRTRFLDCQIGDDLGSDHRPVFVTLDLVESPGGKL